MAQTRVFYANPYKAALLPTAQYSGAAYDQAASGWRPGVPAEGQRDTVRVNVAVYIGPGIRLLIATQATPPPPPPG